MKMASRGCRTSPSALLLLLLTILIYLIIVKIGLPEQPTHYLRRWTQNVAEQARTTVPQEQVMFSFIMWRLLNGVTCSDNRSDHIVQLLKMERSDEIFLIPADEVLEKMNEEQMAAVYWRYINTIQVLCRNQARFGSLKDGGKEVCLDRDFRPARKSCLVYSFGSAFEFSFELEVIDVLGCEVHTFDPTVNLNKNRKRVPKTIHFHPVGLDGHNNVTENKWDMKTLDDIMKELNHENRTIDILKIDIEGSEWYSLAQILKTGTSERVKQLAVETHYNGPGRGHLKVLRDLYDGGFQIFMRDHNTVSVKPLKSEFNSKYTNLNEVSLINTKFVRY